MRTHFPPSMAWELWRAVCFKNSNRSIDAHIPARSGRSMQIYLYCKHMQGLETQLISCTMARARARAMRIDRVIFLKQTAHQRERELALERDLDVTGTTARVAIDFIILTKCDAAAPMPTALA